jgi:signal transduction histidine kinase
MAISSASENAADVVRALKTYLHAGTKEKTAVQLRPNFDAVLTLYQSKLKQGVTDEVNIPTDIEVLGNSGELGQVWSNIIDNAIQAMDNHGHITIEAESQGPCVFIEISNTGSVITKEVRKRLFEPMFTTKPQGEGTGLGLSIVKQIIDEHHGTIWANSNHECTTFTIELPKYKSK